MSANRKLYDTCQLSNKIKQSVEPTDKYNLLIDKFENELNSDHCKKNLNAEIKNTYSDIGKRTDIENDLYVLNKFTNCIDDKFKGCSNSESKKCNIGIVANPYICERDITPTNMFPVKNCGF